MTKIIVDCDPGHDDMIALMAACAHPELELLGVSTVAGNQTGDKTHANALKVMTLIGEKEIPVARGSDHPLFRSLTVAPEIHGVSGLDGADLPEPEVETAEEHAVDLLSRLIRREAEGGGKVTLVPTGPLTNIGMLFIKEPDIKQHIERIVLMGGAVYESNITPSAEFNIYVDPEAAGVVFASGVPLTMVGLDVTNRAYFSFEDIEELKALGGRVSGVVAPLLDFFARANRDIFGIPGAPLHDALAVLAVARAEIVKTRHLNVVIETEGEFTRGRTVTDVYGVTGRPANADVALEVDVPGFKKEIMDVLRRLDADGKD